MDIRKVLLEKNGDIRSFEMKEIEKSLPYIYDIEERLIGEREKASIVELCVHILSDSNSTRTGRRYALSFLKIFHSQSALLDFHVLVDALEEPQFHIIQPVLPRMTSLVKSVENKEIDLIFVKIVIFRAINHTNGWIRTWAIQTAINLNTSLLLQDFNYIPNVILSNLNNNDIFWRILEKSEMDLFTETLSNKIANIENNRKLFFSAFMTKIVNDISCPVSLYFFSTVLGKVEVGAEKVFDVDDISLLRRVVLKARYIPHKSLRIMTLRQFIIFFLKVSKISSKLLNEIAQLVSIISHEATTELVQNLYQTISEILRVVKFKTGINEDEESVMESLENSENKEDLSKMWWTSMVNQYEKQELLASRIELKLSDMLEASQNIDSLLYLIHTRPENVKINVLQIMSNQIGEYILKQVISTTIADFELLQHLYIPIFIKYCTVMINGSVFMVLEILKNQLTCEAHTMLLTFLDAVLEHAKIDDVTVLRVHEYLKTGGSQLELKRQKKTNDEMDMKEFNKIVARLHSLRLKLFLKFAVVENVEQLLIDCIEQLDIASAFSIKQKLCEIISQYISQTSDESLALSCIQAALNIVNEEKKSLNSLPALKSFVDVALKSRGNENEIIAMFENQMLIANQSTQVALVITNGVFDHFENIGISWAGFIVKLCIFGPVPKKESKVTSFCYEKMFTSISCLLEKDQIERLDHVVQITRFKAIVMTVKLAEKNEEWAIELVKNVIYASKLMDQSSSRSFGLSMAHRQKTRAVELVHLIVQYIDNEKFIAELFDYLTSCIIDPCQQFSIKLIVEWTIVNIALKNKKYFEKLASSQFEKYLAESRIGSISSWINMLTLISRSEPNLRSKCLDKVVSWTSAQNFPVRCTAIAASRLMYYSMEEKQQQSYSIVKRIIEFSAEPSGNSKRVIDNLCTDFYFSELNPKKHFDLQTILIIIAEKTGMPAEETIPIEIIESLNQTNVPSKNEDEKFLNAPSDVYSALMKNATSAPSITAENEENDKGEYELVQQNNDEPASFQRKIVKVEEEKDPNRSLIVVASLVDKPTNLGGICRTCEIFGVDSLVISDVLLAQDSNFRALSMSSENWQKIEAVKPQNLLEYLQKLRADGYTVIAVEQTTDSVMMHDFVFPKKSVIVMGDEKEGVPVHLLRAVDKTVEIKQLGHTRSLNVHVTAALMISKFAEQVLYAS